MHLMLCVYDYITETVTICKLKLLGINNSLKPCSQYSLLDSLFDETYAITMVSTEVNIST